MKGVGRRRSPRGQMIRLTVSPHRFSVLKFRVRRWGSASQTDQLSQPDTERLVQRVLDELTTPGCGGSEPRLVSVLLDTGSRVGSTSGELVVRTQGAHPAELEAKAFYGGKRLQTSLGEEWEVTQQTEYFFLILLTPRGRV